MDEYLISLKQKYNYDDEFLELLSRLIPSFINILGEKYKDKILDTFYNVPIFRYDNIRQAEEIIKAYFNNGKEYNISSMAGGFTEDQYYLDENGEWKLSLAICVKNGDKNIVQSLTHEMLHAISFKPPVVEGDVMHTCSGFSTSLSKIENGIKGKDISHKNSMFNELVTENACMQIMDDFDKTHTHEPDAYNSITNGFKGIFRNNDINPVILEDYMNCQYNFADILDSKLSTEEFQKIIGGYYEFCQDNHLYTQFLDNLSKMSVRDFILLYVNSVDNMIKYFPPEQAALEKFKCKVNNSIMYDISDIMIKDKQK